VFQVVKQVGAIDTNNRSLARKQAQITMSRRSYTSHDNASLSDDEEDYEDDDEQETDNHGLYLGKFKASLGT